MQSVRNIPHIETFDVKNEVITIDEDEIQSIRNDETGSHEEPNEIQNNGGTSKLIYYFEPQEKTNFTINADDKSKLT